MQCGIVYSKQYLILNFKKRWKNEKNSFSGTPFFISFHYDKKKFKEFNPYFAITVTLFEVTA